MPTELHLERTVTDLIEASLGIEVPDASTDLIATGLLDSLGVVTLITEIEMGFGRMLPLDTLDLESFRSVDRICAFLDAEGVGS